MRNASRRRSAFASSDVISPSIIGAHSFHSLTTFPSAYAASQSSSELNSSRRSLPQSIFSIALSIQPIASSAVCARVAASREPSSASPRAPPALTPSATFDMNDAAAALTGARTSSSGPSSPSMHDSYRSLSSTNSLRRTRRGGWKARETSARLVAQVVNVWKTRLLRCGKAHVARGHAPRQARALRRRARVSARGPEMRILGLRLVPAVL